MTTCIQRELGAAISARSPALHACTHARMQNDGLCLLNDTLKQERLHRIHSSSLVCTLIHWCETRLGCCPWTHSSGNMSRMLKELKNLAPWQWDPRVTKHPPGAAALRDFQKVGRRSVWRCSNVCTHTGCTTSPRQREPPINNMRGRCGVPLVDVHHTKRLALSRVCASGRLCVSLWAVSAMFKSANVCRSRTLGLVDACVRLCTWYHPHVAPTCPADRLGVPEQRTWARNDAHRGRRQGGAVWGGGATQLLIHLPRSLQWLSMCRPDKACRLFSCCNAGPGPGCCCA